MKAVLVLSLVALTSAFHIDDPDSPLESDEIIDAVNKANTTWKAGRNFGPSYKKRHLKFLLGVREQPGASELLDDRPPLDDDEEEDFEPPESFDARVKWPFCKSIQEVRDQGPCGSCWAVSAAATFTDRLCIATKGKFKGHLSEQDLTTCCRYCVLRGGCNGGVPYAAWKYFQDTGICTGGDYQSHEGCQPYTVPACEHHVKGPLKNCSEYQEPYPTPKCQNTCYNKGFNHTKDQDIHKVKKVVSISYDVKKIQKEIYENGPVQASFEVYEDFLSYKTGVYSYIKGPPKSGHAVKVIGWGTEKGTEEGTETPYWLVANSWNSDWGDKGFFKIKRGNNECGFERDINGGYPDV